MTFRRGFGWAFLLSALLVPVVVVHTAAATGGAIPPEDPTAAQLAALGCDDPYVQCINACSGRVIPHLDRDQHPAELRIPEEELVTVRAVGRPSCAPSTISCTSRTVSVSNVGFLPAASASGASGAPSPGSDVSSFLTEAAEETATPAETDIATLQGALTTQERAATTLSATAKVGLAAAPDAGAAPGPRAALTNAQAAAQRASIGLEAAGAARKLASGRHGLGLSKALYALARVLSADATAPDTTGCAAALTRAVNQVHRIGARLATMGASGGGADRIGAVATLNKKVAQAQADLAALGTALAAVAPDAAAAADAGAPAGTTPSVCVAPSPLTAAQVSSLIATASTAVDSIDAARKAARAAQTLYADWSILTDCMVTIPRGTSVREALVDVAMTHAAATPGGEDAGTRTTGTAAPPPATHAIARFAVDHGKYYYDVVTVAGIVVAGQHSIVSATRPGQPGAYEIGIDSGNHTLFGLGLTVYPAGHRREVYAVWDGYTRWWDMLGLQAGFDATSLNAPFPTIFTGVALEPITGLSFGCGAAFEPSDRLINGYTLGMAPPANRADYVNGTNVAARFYASLSIGYELFHTTGANIGVAAAGGGGAAQ